MCLRPALEFSSSPQRTFGQAASIVTAALPSQQQVLLPAAAPSASTDNDDWSSYTPNAILGGEAAYARRAALSRTFSPTPLKAAAKPALTTESGGNARPQSPPTGPLHSETAALLAETPSPSKVHKVAAVLTEQSGEHRFTQGEAAKSIRADGVVEVDEAVGVSVSTRIRGRTELTNF